MKFFRYSLAVVFLMMCVRYTCGQSATSSIVDDSFIVEHFAGSFGGSGVRDARGTEARFTQPGSVWADSDAVYLADISTIRRISKSAGDVVTLSGTPQSILDWAGYISGDERYLYQAKGTAVYRVDKTTGQSTIFAGSPSTADLVDGPGNLARFRGPYALSRDGTFLYALDIGTCNSVGQGMFRHCVPDKPATIRQVSLQTAEVHTIPIPQVQTGANPQPPPSAIWASNGVLYLGYPNDATTVGIGKLILSSLTFTPLYGLPPPGYVFGHPTSFQGDGRGGIYFIDVGTGANSYSPITGRALKRIALDTGNISTVAVPIPGAVNELEPIDLSISGDELFVTDFLNKSVIRIHLPTMTTEILAGLPSNVEDIVSGRIPKENLSAGIVPADRLPPSSVWGDGHYLYIVAGYAVYRIALATGETRHIAGDYLAHGDVDGVGSAARFNGPGGLWGDGSVLYVADGTSIRRVDLSTNEVTHFVVNTDHVPLQPLSWSAIWGDGTFLYAYVGYFNGIRRVRIATAEVTTFATPGLSVLPGGLWGDGTYLYMAGNGVLAKANLSTGAVSPVGTLGTQIVAITGAAGQIFFSIGAPSTTQAAVILSMDIATGAVRAIAGDPRFYGTEDGPGTEARFTNPQGLWSDGTAISVADHGSAATGSAIRVIKPAQTSTTFSLATAGASSWIADRSGAFAGGYAEVVASPGAKAPEGVAIYSSRQNEVLVDETAVAASEPVLSGRVYVELDGPVTTGAAIANPNDQAATVSFYFTDANGNDFGGGGITIPANGQVVGFFDQSVFPSAAGPPQRSAARTFTFSSSLPVGVVALRGFVNERSEFLTTTLPVAPVAPDGNAPILLPLFAAGGGWTTQVLLTSPTDNPVTGTVEFLNRDGSSADSENYSIAPRSAAKMVSTDTSATIRTGSIRIVPAVGSIDPIASTVFSFVNEGVTVTESGWFFPERARPSGSSSKLTARLASPDQFGRGSP